MGFFFKYQNISLEAFVKMIKDGQLKSFEN